MIPALIALTSGILIFSIMSICFMLILKPKREINERIGIVSAEKGSRASEKTGNRFRREKPGKVRGTTVKKTKKRLKKLESEFYDAGIHLPVQKLIAVWGGAAVGLPTLIMIAGTDIKICIAAVVILAIGPTLFVKIRKNKRREQLESQLTEAISVMINALKAGHSFQSSMNSIALEMKGPVAEEFGRVFRETQHGMPLAESLERMVERTESEDLGVLTTAILIQREVGGNLAEVLENISGTIASRLSLKAEVKTRTASGRMSGYIIGALPILLLIAMNVLSPDYSSMLFTTQIGKIMLAAGAIMEVIGMIVIKKITDIKY